MLVQIMAAPGCVHVDMAGRGMVTAPAFRLSRDQALRHHTAIGIRARFANVTFESLRDSGRTRERGDAEGVEHAKPWR
jgi:hypothetical protein